MNILHILNGECTLQIFEQTGLEGGTIVWNEVLSEGPLEENISSGSFWRARQKWITEIFNLPPEKYQEKTLNSLAGLTKPYGEINLWFEYDLHCQVNLLGVMNYLKLKGDLSLPSIYLICPADFPGIEDFRGMGELEGRQLEYLFDNNRVQLSEIDFAVAAGAWVNYVCNDAEKLKHYIENNKFWANLHCLKAALEAHLKRLRFNENGLNYIEQKLLNICNTGIANKTDIYAYIGKGCSSLIRIIKYNNSKNIEIRIFNIRKEFINNGLSVPILI